MKIKYDMKINLNDFVKVKFTDLGKDIYYHRFDKVNEDYGCEIIKPTMPKVDSEGKTAIQLWEFIQLYGEYIGMTKPNVIEPLDLEIEI